MRVRDAIRDLPASRIAEISALGMGDPEVIPLWYGEGDLTTPEFIGAAANTASLYIGGALDSLMEPVRVGALLLRTPVTLFWGFFGYFFSRHTDVMAVFRR